MNSTRRALTKILLGGVLTTIASLYCLPARAQIINYVGVESYNPFTAELVTTSTFSASEGAQKTKIRREYVARDSRGRIRFEKREVGHPAGDPKTITLETPEGRQFTVTREEYGTLIRIFDHPAGTATSIQPGMRIATVTKIGSVAPTRQPSRSFSRAYLPGPGAKISTQLIFEPLGEREIQGIQATGVMRTSMGKDEDGDFKGKPVRQVELWFSDSLGVKLLTITRDMKTGDEDRAEVVAIKAGEPDPAIFEIPEGYVINPGPRERPMMKASGEPERAEH
jgi:hypothetical protein